MTSQETNKLLQTFPIADSYFEEKAKFKDSALKVSMVQLQRSKLKKHLEITNQEVQGFLSQEKNLERVKEMFEGRKKQLDQSEQVLASHILLRTQGKNKNEKDVLKKAKDIRQKLTPQNFAQMAKKYTESPQGKQKAGSLGWFERGRMVPAFDEYAFNAKAGAISKPIKTRFGYHLIHVRDKKEAKKAKFEEHKVRLAKELLRNQKQEELDQLVAGVKERAQKALNNDQFGALKNLEKEYGFRLETQTKLNLLSGTEGSIFVEPKELTAIFHGEQKFYTFSSPERETLVKVHGKVDVTSTQKKVAQEKQRLQQTLAKKLQQTVLEKMRNRVSVKVFSDRLR